MASYYDYSSCRTGGSNGNGGGDHVCRPVLVDAQGRRTPLGYMSNMNGLQGYVVKAAEGGGGIDQLSEHLIRGGGHGRHHAYASNVAGDEDQDLFEKIRREVSRPKSSSWNTMQEHGKYAAATSAAATATQQILHFGSPAGKYSSAGVEVPPPPYYGRRETIDSEEAKSRYGRWGTVPPPRRESYGTVDSAAAAARYGGVRF
ncbi:PREDICTED: uncharacterized protein LOC109191427 [Ipomoea nil]|uniref:uncharacterized protein LOC109191427 n=1 Tax=Ipomoea nil TaxID=35883 RepID=UPI0009010DCC|nr:PREDICTED: uncharacterized protein LOC109191427 [Ipomoea nil]